MRVSAIFFVVYILTDSTNCRPNNNNNNKDWERKFMPLRMKQYEGANNYKTTPSTPSYAPTTATPAAAYPAPASSGSSGSSSSSGIQSLFNIASGQTFQPLLVLLVPVPAAAVPATTTTAAPATTSAPAPTTEEYGYEPIGSY